MAIFPSKAECRRDPVARVGFWILTGVFFLIVAGWTLWWRFTNEPRVHLTLYFRSSVHGVDVGSPVKINGIAVGQIESLGVRTPTKTDGRYYAEIKVVMDGDLLASKGLPRELDDRLLLADEIRRGLRGRLRLISPMTGGMYLEFEYAPDEPALLVAPESENVAEVPTLADPLSSGLVEVTHRLAEMEKTDFAAAGREVADRLDVIAAALPPEAFRDAGEALKQRLTELRAALADDGLRGKIADVNAGLVSLRQKIAAYREKRGDPSEALAALAKLRTDLAAAASETEKIARATDPRSPRLLVTYARFAVVRDNAAHIGRLCDEIVNANGYVGSIFKAVATVPDTGGTK